MAEKHGNLSINSENIFPIIKKWLYSDHDIFGRGAASFASAARSGQYLWHGATVDIFDDGHHQAGTGEGDRYIFN